jgi:hypothetical protein
MHSRTVSRLYHSCQDSGPLHGHRATQNYSFRGLLEESYRRDGSRLAKVKSWLNTEMTPRRKTASPISLWSAP